MAAASPVLYGGVRLPGVPDLENVRRLDLLPVPATMEMMRYGMAVDKDWLHQLSTRLGARAKELRREVCDYIPASKLDEFVERADDEDEYDVAPMNVDSPSQLAMLLFDVLEIGKGKRLKRTNSGDRISTARKQLEQLKGEKGAEVIQPVLDYRRCMKLKTTYTDKLPRIAVRHPRGASCPVCELPHAVPTDRIHTDILSTRTGTGRYASKDPNLQNIPIRTEDGADVRRGFVASPGTELVSADYSQQEMRLGAHYSNDANLIRIFEQGLDPHADTARRAFNLGADEVPDKLTQRDPCKNVNFAAFYDISPQGLYDLMAVTYAESSTPLPEWLTVDWCGAFINQWFDELYPAVRAYLEDQWYRARRYGMVWTLFGRTRKVPEVRSVHPRISSAGLRQAGNMPIQGSGADWIRAAIAEVRECVVEVMRAHGVWCWPLMTVHDEILLEVEQGYGWLALQEMREVMQRVMQDRETGEELCRVPVCADGKVMQRWEK